MPIEIDGHDHSDFPCSRIISSPSNVTLASPASTPSTSSHTSPHMVFSCSKIESLLIRHKDHFVIIDNESKKLTSSCWQLFGFPATVDSNGGPPQRIEKFVSCRRCYKTYSFTSNSTRFLLDHVCSSSNATDGSNIHASSSSAASSCSPSTSQQPITLFTTPRKSRLTEMIKNKIKHLEARWIGEDMRPFTIVDDPGFRRIAQELVSVGKSFFLRKEWYLTVDYSR